MVDFITACTNSIQWRQGKLHGRVEKSGSETDFVENPLSRVKSEMSVDDPGKPLWFEMFPEKDAMDAQIEKMANCLASTYFATLRNYIASYVDIIFNMFFKMPLYSQLGTTLAGGFVAIEEELFNSFNAERLDLIQQKEKLQKQLKEFEEEIRQFEAGL